MDLVASAPSTIVKDGQVAHLKLGKSIEPIYVRSDGGMFTLSLAIVTGWETYVPKWTDGQPTEPGFWVDDGVPKFFDGENNKVVSTENIENIINFEF